MDERTIQDIICKYPNLIEENLSFKGKEVNLKGKRVDVLFEDRHGQKLIIEVKRGTILREHISQLLDYEGYFVSTDNPDVRVMLVGARVPDNFRRSLDHHGFEWRELTINFLVNFLKQNNDSTLLARFKEEDVQIYDKYQSEYDQNQSIKKALEKPVKVKAHNFTNPSKDLSPESIQRQVNIIHEEFLKDSSFHTVRLHAEASAKEMLRTKIGKMTPADILVFLDYVNTESIKGKTRYTRFGSQFKNIISKQICGCPNEFNEWINLLWNAGEDQINIILERLLVKEPIKGAGTILPTFVLYLRNPKVFNIWTKNLENNLANTFSRYDLPTEKQNQKRYAHFNRHIFDLLVNPFNLKPEEVDLVLSHLP